MKKIISILLVIFVLISISACNRSTPAETDVISDENNSEVDIEETIEDTAYDKISGYLKEESEKVFSPYYELLDFQISDYEEKVVNGNIEATFLYTIIYKNYDRDPDTVDYIKEAKESGNKNYQQMYDEYLQPKEMNFHFKVIIDENGFITLYSNIAPKGIEWEETEMKDFILN